MESIEQSIVREIIADLSDRAGSWWDGIDDETKAEIRAAWLAIVERGSERIVYANMPNSPMPEA